MHSLMKKIFLGHLLFGPADPPNSGGTPAGASPGTPDSQKTPTGAGADDIDSNAGGDDDDDDDSILADLLGDDTDITIEEEPGTGLDQNKVRASTQQLSTHIQSVLAGMTIKESDIPENLNWEDRAGVAQFMSQRNEANSKAVLGLVPKMLEHTLNLIVPQLEERMMKKIGSTAKTSDAQRAFNELGFTGADSDMAKTFFKKAIKNNNNDLRKAANATKKAMAALGVRTGGSVGNSAGGDSNSSVKSGSAALDSLFS